MRRLLGFAVPLCGAVLAFASTSLPDGPGRAQIEAHCQTCHDIAQSVSVRQDRAGWSASLLKMVGLGVKASDPELEAMLDYLAKHFPAEELPPVNINAARAIQLESRLSLLRSQASAILRHRKEHGDFRSFDDLRAVEGLDIAKLEAKRHLLVFQ